VNFDEPIYEDTSHLPSDFVLNRHVVGFGHGGKLRERAEVWRRVSFVLLVEISKEQI
jgi:hypothetical protein